jgi:tetratricopeptide (TPR) repeat protein
MLSKMKILAPLLLCVAFLFAVTLSAQPHDVQTDECTSSVASSSNNDGNRHDKKGEYQKAIDDYKKAMRAEPTCSASYINLGATYFEMERFDDSVKALFEAAKYTSSLRWVIFNNIGRAYSSLGDFKDALEAFTQAIKLEPKDPRAYSSRARLYLVLGRGDLAVADVQTLLKLKGWKSPSAPEWAVVAYIGYRQQKLDDQASQFLGDAATKIPDKTTDSTAIFKFFIKKIDADQLLAMAKDRGEDDRPDKEKEDLTEAHVYIGMYLLLSGQKKEAREQFEWVQDNGSKKPTIFQLAMTELRQIKSGAAAR